MTIRPLYICPTPGTKRLNKPAIQGSCIFLIVQENVRGFETEVPENQRSIGNHRMNEKMDPKEYCDPRKYRKRDRRILAAMMIHFRDQVARGYVKRHSACYRQCVRHRKS